MPLSAAQDRKILHTRTITIRGYERADGNFDVEGHLTDVKSYPIDNHDRGAIPPGEPLHEMWMRMTLDEDLNILACEAATDHSPYTICPSAAPNFAGLAGLSIKPGFLRAAAERIGGVKGCTHLREMLQQMATTAFQTTASARVRRPAAAKAGRKSGEIAVLNTCLAYGAESPVVRRLWPELYTGPEAA